MTLAKQLPYLDCELVYSLECICPMCRVKHIVQEFWASGHAKVPRVYCDDCKTKIARRKKYEQEAAETLRRKDEA